MPLILTTPPAAEPVSLADAKAHLRITHSDDDTYLGKLITAARRAVESRTGLRLITQGWSLFLDRWPETAAASLQLAPVQVVVDIIVHGEDDTPATLDGAHYFLDAVNTPARVVLRDGRTPPRPGRSVNGIEIRFTAGFGASADAVPADLRQAVLLTLAHWSDHRGDAEGGSLPLAALELLDTFRIVRLT
jgi:uncharacterized phiE125 gp8 family phage protein